jgi:hypothetical protein
MRPCPRHLSWSERKRRAARGSVLITALLIAVAIAISLASYLHLGRTSLRVASRTYFLQDAGNLAEGGLEQALYCFNAMGAGATPTVAWEGWTTVGTAAMRVLPPVNRDQNAVAVVKVYVYGYSGVTGAPYIISQATITPFDGSAPIVKVVQCGLKNNTGYSMNGIVGLNGFTIKGQSIADSFNSNPTNSPTGPWRAYSTAIARSNTRVIVPTGLLSLGNGKIYGNLFIGPNVTAPPASQVTGIIQSNFTGTFKMPAYPVKAAVSQSYTYGSALPATLPQPTHVPASDGLYYYFCTGATVANTTVTTGANIVIVGTNTGMGSGLTLQGTATCTLYIDGPVNCTGVINNGTWAGALRIFTTTTSACTIGNNGQIVACLYAPNAALNASGGGTTGMLVGYFLAKTILTSGHMDFHYDEALQPFSGGNPWQLTQWTEIYTAAEKASLSTLTNNFLP